MSQDETQKLPRALPMADVTQKLAVIRPVAAALRRADVCLIVLVCLAGFLVAFDDIAPLRTIGGGIGASPAWIPLLLCAFLIPRPRLDRWMWVAGSLWVLGLVVTLVTFLLLPSQMRGVNTYFKALAVGVPIAVFISVIVIAALLAKHEPRLIALFGLVSLGTLLLFALLDMTGLISTDKSGFLHGLENLNQRARGSRFEASALGAGVLTAVATAAYTVRSVRVAAGTAVAAVALCFLLPSRGTLLAGLLFAMAIGAVIALRHWGRLRAKSVAALVPSFLVVITLAGGFGLGFLTPALKLIGLSYSTSDAVRSVWSDVGLDVAVHYPVGMGYAAPLSWLPPYVQGSMDQFSGSYRESDFDELVDQLAAEGGYGFSPKTMPALTGVYLGLLGVLVLVALWVLVARRSVTSTQNGYLMTIPAALTLCLMAATYFSSIYAWEQAFLIGALLVAQRKAVTDGG